MLFRSVQKRVGCIHPVGISIDPTFVPDKPNFPTPDDFKKKAAWTLPEGMDVRNVRLVQYKFQLDPLFVPADTSKQQVDTKKD